MSQEESTRVIPILDDIIATPVDIDDNPLRVDIREGLGEPEHECSGATADATPQRRGDEDPPRIPGSSRQEPVLGSPSGLDAVTGEPADTPEALPPRPDRTDSPRYHYEPATAPGTADDERTHDPGVTEDTVTETRSQDDPPAPAIDPERLAEAILRDLLPGLERQVRETLRRHLEPATEAGDDRGDGDAMP